VRFLDYDNDGWKDLLIAQGHDLDTIEKSFPQLRYKEPMMLLRNVGGRFVNVSSISSEMFSGGMVGRGMAIGDLNNDGRIDAVVSTNGGTPHVLLNETETQNHWITLKLVGHKSNHDGIGAQVKIVTWSGEQWGTVTTFQRLTFPQGSAATLWAWNGASWYGASRIRWPSGIQQVMTNITGDQQVRVDEPSHSDSKNTSRGRSRTQELIECGSRRPT